MGRGLSGCRSCRLSRVSIVGFVFLLGFLLSFTRGLGFLLSTRGDGHLEAYLVRRCFVFVRKCCGLRLIRMGQEGVGDWGGVLVWGGGVVASRGLSFPLLYPRRGKSGHWALGFWSCRGSCLFGYDFDVVERYAVHGYAEAGDNHSCSGLSKVEHCLIL